MGVLTAPASPVAARKEGDGAFEGPAQAGAHRVSPSDDDGYHCGAYLLLNESHSTSLQSWGVTRSGMPI